MADDSTVADMTPAPVDRLQLIRYVEDMLVELAQLASGAGEPALAASLAMAAIHAGATAAGLSAPG